MPDTPSTGEPTEEQIGEPVAAEHESADTGVTGSEREDGGVEEVTVADHDEPSIPGPPPAPAAPEPPQALSGAGERGQRRITRETHTTTTRSHSETTTHETSTTIEDIDVAPPVYAAPTSEHPRPVG